MRPYQEGDLASFPVTPHAEGVTALRHADSALRLGGMPENANQKDFIRKGHSLHADPEALLRVRPRGAPPARSFGPEFSAHSHEAARKLRAEVRRGVRSGAIRRPGESEAGAGEPEAEAGMAMASLVSGPRRHAEVVLESEAVRGNLSGATGLSRILAQRSGAPSAASPAPEHHFYFGGTRAQKRRVARRAETLARAREANLAMRKEALLRGNVDELERLAREYEEEEARNAEILRGAAGVEFVDAGPGPGSAPAALSASPPPPPPPARPPAQPASYSTPLSWAVFGALGLVLAGVAVYGLRRGRGRGRR